MAELYVPQGIQKTGENFRPLNKNMESLFISQIEKKINDNLTYIKNNTKYFTYDIEDFVYKICYVSITGNFSIIYITIFIENSLFYYEISKKTGESSVFTEFINFFENQSIPQDISQTMFIPQNIRQNLKNIDRKNTLLQLYSYSTKNSLEYNEFYTTLFEQEDDWENTFLIIEMLNNINISQEDSKKQIEKCFKKLRDISRSSNIRKDIIEKSINNFIDKHLEKYNFDKQFLEFVEKQKNNLINTTNTTNISDILELFELSQHRLLHLL